MKKGKWQVPLVDGKEQDLLTGYYYFLAKGRGERKWYKRKYQRRARQVAKAELKQCQATAS